MFFFSNEIAVNKRYNQIIPLKFLAKIWSFCDAGSFAS